MPDVGAYRFLMGKTAFSFDWQGKLRNQRSGRSQQEKQPRLIPHSQKQGPGSQQQRASQPHPSADPVRRHRVQDPADQQMQRPAAVQSRYGQKVEAPQQQVGARRYIAAPQPRKGQGQQQIDRRSCKSA